MPQSQGFSARRKDFIKVNIHTYKNIGVLTRISWQSIKAKAHSEGKIFKVALQEEKSTKAAKVLNNLHIMFNNEHTLIISCRVSYLDIPGMKTQTYISETLRNLVVRLPQLTMMQMNCISAKKMCTTLTSIRPTWIAPTSNTIRI